MSVTNRRRERIRATGPRLARRRAALGPAIRRLAGVAILVGAFAVALGVYAGGLQSPAPGPLLAAAMLTVTTAAFVLSFPWGRFDPRWFLVVLLPVLGLIAWVATLTGGLGSPVLAFTLVAVAFAGAYRGGWTLAASIGLAAAVPLAVGLLGPASGGPSPLAVTLVLLPSLAGVAAVARLAVEGRLPAGAEGAWTDGAFRGRAPRLRTPRAIDDAVLSSLSLDGVLDQLLDGAAGRLQVASLCLSLAGGRVFRCESAAEASAAGAALGNVPRPARANGVGPGNGNGTHAGAEADGGVLEVPVAIGGDRLGTLRVVPFPGRALDERQRALARDLAAQAAVAVERARLFDRISRATQELEALFHALRQGIAIAGRDGRILRANRAFAEILGLSPEAIVARPAAHVLPGGVVPALSHDQVIDPEERATHEVEDEGRVFEVTTTPLFDPELLLIGQVHTLRDVTEERRMKEHLIQSEKLAAMGQLVAGVSHELSSPIGIILGHAELLASTAGLDADTRQSAEAILGQADRAARTVRHLLSVGRRHAPVKEPICLNTLLRGVVGLVETDFRVNRRRPIRLALALDPSLPTIMADPHQLEQVFLNVLNNARQAVVSADLGSRIGISTAAHGRAVRVRIADDGPGIPAGVLRRIFDPFFTTKPEGEGTGLGLSICYGLVEEHGGRIWAESVEGRGAAFTIELPIDGRPGAC